MVFVSIREHVSSAIFLRARARVESVQLMSSKHFLHFPLAAIHMEILFFKIKQKIF